MFNLALISELLRAAGILKRSLEVRTFLSWRGLSITSTNMVADISQYCHGLQTIIDVGANIGQFTLAAARRFPTARIYSFEPVPDVVSRLKSHVRHYPQVRVFHSAVGSTSGKLIFYRNNYTHVSSALRISAATDQPGYDLRNVTPLEVEFVRLDQALGGLTLDAPVLLKIDVQGYEMEVLKGWAGLKQQIDYLVLECSFVKLYEEQPLFDELHSYIEEQGFGFVAPVGFNRGKQGAIIEMDALYRRIPAS